MEQRKRVGLGILVIAAFMTSFVMTMWRLGGWHVAQQTMPPEVLHIAPEAEFVRTYVLDDGTRGGSVISGVRNDWIGLSAVEFAALHPEWELLSFSPQRLVVAETCAFEESTGFIRLENGQPMLYAGQPSGCYRRLGALAADVAGMSPLLHQELVAGITYESESDLNVILEGLRAP